MTIDEAIELLNIAKEGWPLSNGEKYYEALELGIEALKRVQWHKEQHLKGYYELLPRETEK